MVRPGRRVPVATVLLGALALAASGCGDDGGEPPTCLPDCAGDRSYDAISYDLRASFDWTTSTLTGSEDITVAIGASPVIALDAQVAVTAVHAGDAAVPFVADDTGLRVDLTALAATTATVTFTVDYTAEASSALRVGGPRDDDPVTSRVVFTDSEPDRGSLWLVGKHDPSDRALWSVDVAVAPDQDVIANGARTGDATAGTERHVRYALDKPIPTYLMAFAAGDLVHADRTTGRVPLAVWYRRGLAVDPEATLDVVADSMTAFEAVIGPYPWDSYAVVLAPGYGGGMENATITFNAETSGQGTVSLSLNAHELAHHWFGDWVTMRTYDDVWVKEGMATVLQSEADRARRDRTAAAARLFGYDFTFDPSDAIVDDSLTGLDKYTSGPYQRAAWLITQIRHEVGDPAFWASLRQVLADHALDSITGAEFIASFPLAPAAAARALASLPAFDVPSIDVVAAPDGTGTALTFAATDPAGTLIAPIDITVVDGSGTSTTQALAPGVPVVASVPTAGYLALDNADVHPMWEYSFGLSGDADVALGLTVPYMDAGASTAAVAEFVTRSAATEERVFDRGMLPSQVPGEIAAMYPVLDSVYAQRSAVLDACGLVPGLPPAEADAMTTALAPLLATPSVVAYTTRFGRCGLGGSAPLAAELATLADTVTAATAGRLEYLLGFDYGAATSLDVIGRVATTAPSLRLRERAIGRLVSQASGSGGSYAVPTAGETAAYQTFFRDRLPGTTSQTRLLLVWSGIRTLADLVPLPTVAGMLHTVPLADYAQVRIVCDAAAMTIGTPSAWAAFQAAAMPYDTLAVDAAAALADSSICFGKPGRPHRAAARADGGGEQIVERWAR